MTGTAILWLCLKLLGAEVSYYVPHRIDEGYGLNGEAIRTLAAEKAEVLVTVDCGIGSVDEAALARELGVELIVTDHHEPGPRLPEAAAIVHPRLPGGDYPFGGLSGSGVALKLAWALCQQASGAKRVGAADEGFSGAGGRAWPRWAPWPTSCRWSTKIASWSAMGWRAWPTRRRSGWPR